MNVLKALLNSKVTQNFSETQDTKPRILFVCPQINSQGYYRMILPYLELPKYGYHTRLIGLKKYDFNTTYTLDNLGLTPQMIAWADYIVFKQLTKDYTYFFHAIRKHNVDVTLVMDIDKPIYGLPKSHPEYAKIDLYTRGSFLSNLKSIDLVTSFSKESLDFYEHVACRAHKNISPSFEHIPNLLPAKGLAITCNETDKEHNKIRIGLVTSKADYRDVLLLKSVLKYIHSHFEDYLTFVVLGWDGTIDHNKNCLQGLPMEYHKSVSFLKHHQTIHSLSLDMMLLPVSPIPYNTYRSELDYLECAAIKIPVIASANSVYGACVIHEESGLLVTSESQWIAATTLLIENIKLRRQLADNAFDMTSKSYAFSSNSIAYYTDVYV